MTVDPRIEALREDADAQRVLQQAIAQALAECGTAPGFDAVRQALARYGAGAPLDECPALEALLREGGAGRAAIGALIARLLRLQREHPLAQLGFRHRSQAGFHELQLATRGRAVLGLALFTQGACEPGPDAATFVDAERHEVVLAGRAEIAELLIDSESVGAARIAQHRRRIGPGDRLRSDGPRSALVVRRVTAPLLVLRLDRRAAAPGPTRRYALPSGELLQRASGSREESRMALMAMVLGRMGRRDSVPTLLRLAEADSGMSPASRWDMLRECLALDPAAGFATLGRIANDGRDPLAEAAGALRGQLADRYPRLGEQEREPCPA